MNNEDREANSEEFGALQRMITILRSTTDPYETHDAVETYRSAVLHTTATRMENRENGHVVVTEYGQGRADALTEHTVWLRLISQKRSYHP
jgi:hypothetical protein